MIEAKMMNTSIKTTSPASPKTIPARGLSFQNFSPFDPELPPEGGVEAGVICVTVTSPSGPVVESGRVAVGEAEDTGELFVESSMNWYG
jgi:hypothetical protein